MVYSNVEELKNSLYDKQVLDSSDPLFASLQDLNVKLVNVYNTILPVIIEDTYLNRRFLDKDEFVRFVSNNLKDVRALVSYKLLELIYFKLRARVSLFNKQKDSRLLMPIETFGTFFVPPSRMSVFYDKQTGLYEYGLSSFGVVGVVYSKLDNCSIMKVKLLQDSVEIVLSYDRFDFVERAYVLDKSHIDVLLKNTVLAAYTQMFGNQKFVSVTSKRLGE